MRSTAPALALASVLFIGLVLGAVPAEGQSTSAGIIGQVTDSTGAILPGVTVTATSPALQVPQVLGVTDEHGEYRLSPLPIGTYTVTYELPGFQTLRRENIRLPVGFVAKLDQVLSPGTVQETVTVTGASPVVDVTNPATSVDLSSDAIEILPTNRDGLKAFMSQVPGMRTNLDVGASSMTDTIQIRAYGQTGAPWQMLEGIMFASSGGNGVQGAHVDFNALESTRLETVATNAEMPKRGQFIDAVVKSGGNEFHGEGVTYGSVSELESANVSEKLRLAGIRGVPKLHGMWDDSGSLGGRLIRDKLWFFGAYRYEGYNRELLNAFYPDGSPVLIKTGQTFHTEKLSWQVSQGNRISVFEHQQREVQRRGATQFVPPESMEITIGPVSMYKADWQAVKGNSFVFQLQYGNWYKHAYYFSLPAFDSTGPHKVATMDLATTYVTGDHLSDQRIEDYFNDHTKGSVSFYRSNLLGGNHQFKAGFDNVFSGYPHKQGSRPGGNYQLLFQNGTPFEINTFNYPVRPYNSQQYFGVYGQDNWTVTRRLSLALGVRYGHDNAYAPKQCREKGDFAPAQCWDKIQMRIWNSWVPRAHFAYDLFGDAKTVIKGGFGRFANLRQINNEVVNLNRNNRQTTLWLWHDNGNRLYDPGEVNLDPNGPDFQSISGVTNAIPNPNEIQPLSDEWSLSFERELQGGWAVRTTGIYARNFRLRRLAELSRPYDAYNIAITNTDPGPDNVRGNTDDPGKSITYYEYPSSLSGLSASSTMLVNWPGEQVYKTIELAATRRLARKWQFSASYSATHQDVPFTDGQALNPNSEINTAVDTWETTGKLAGAYLFPLGLAASFDYERRSGAPQARQVQFTGGQTIRSIVLNVEPLGTIHLPNTHLANIRLTKRFSFGGGHTLETRFDYFNVLNANFVTNRTVRAGSSYLLPMAIILPRILQVGASYRF